MNIVFIALLLQAMLMPPRIALENPAALTVMPKRLQKDYDKAWTLFQAGNKDAALSRDLDKLLKKEKDFEPALVIHGYLDLYTGRSHEAEDRFETVLRREPSHRIALYYLAELAYERNDFLRANDLYSRLLMLPGTPRDLETKQQKALLLAVEGLLKDAVRSEAAGNLSDAETFYSRALQIAPTEPSLHA